MNNDRTNEGSRRYRAFVFDLDGTLLDTLGDLAASTNHTLQWAGLPVRSLDEVRRFVGNGVTRLLERSAGEAVMSERGDAWFAAFCEEFRRYYLLHGQDQTRPYPGVLEMLEELSRCGCKVSVVSNKFHEATYELCNHYFGSLVQAAVGEGHGIRRKPCPDGVVEALRLMGSSAAEAVYVGDSDVDIATAAASGLPCVSVTWGFRDRSFLVEHGARCLADTPAEVVRLASGQASVCSSMNRCTSSL